MATAPPTVEPTHREILLAMSGVMLGMFVAMISGTIVINALPMIVPDLGGGQLGYTWVVIANTLAITATIPVWGKMADRLDLKKLLRVALVIYVVGCLISSLAGSIGILIAARAVQGVGIGGLSALSQATIARLAPPRQRARYAGYMNVCWAVGTISGPLVGGLVVDSPLGWRGCFLVGIPFAIISLVVMARTLRLPHVPQPVDIDYLGAALIVLGVSCVLLITSLGGNRFAWASPETGALVLGAVVLLGAALLVEGRLAADPIVRLALFRNRTILLTTLAASLVGVSLMSAVVFLTEYYQYGRGLSPTESGLLTSPMVIALAATGIINGRAVAHWGRWKPTCLFGCAVIAAGNALIGMSDHSTPLAQVALGSAVLGVGLGCTSANMVLAVQNVVHDSEVASATSLVTFFQTLGGAVAVAVLGVVLGRTIASSLPEIGHSLPDPQLLAPDLRERYQEVLGSGVAELFLLITPLALVSLALIALVPGGQLRTTALKHDEPSINS